MTFDLKVARVKESISRVIFGQDTVIELVLVNILSGGHALLIGVPGLAKTSLVDALGSALGLNAKRIQFTPDLMPSDIVGTEVLEEKAGSRSFRFVQGPVFAQLLMADEINRASPKTQSRFSRRCRSSRLRTPDKHTAFPRPFSCSLRRTRWSRKVPIRCPRPSSTGSCCKLM